MFRTRGDCEEMFGTGVSQHQAMGIEAIVIPESLMDKKQLFKRPSTTRMLC